MELRYLPVNADVQEGDELTTSGVDGVYPPGVPVAKVVKVERPADSAFAKVYCVPMSQILGPRHVMVLDPVVDALNDPSNVTDSQKRPSSSRLGTENLSHKPLQRGAAGMAKPPSAATQTTSLPAALTPSAQHVVSQP
jgi:hypothetical protein